VAPPPSSAPPEPAPYETQQVPFDVPSIVSATLPAPAIDERTPPSVAPAPAVALAARPKARPKQISNDWLQKRVFELRVPMSDIGMGVPDLLTVLQSLDDTQPLLPQVKMWIGLEENQDVHGGLAQLVEEFATLRKQSS